MKTQNTIIKRRRVSHQEPTNLPEKARTQQQFMDECDINKIIKKAQKGIQPLFLQRGVPQYGDFSNVPNLQQAYELVENAHDAFLNLPSGLRSELNNDPANINRITAEQIARYKLSKEDHLPQHPNQPSTTPPKAGQAAPSGTEPDAKKSQKNDQKGQE